MARPGEVDGREQPTTAQLEADIDRGRTGDKVDWPDSAAAPLGTDDEAAGAPPSPARVVLARAQESRFVPYKHPNGGWTLGAIFGAVVVVIGVLIWAFGM